VTTHSFTNISIQRNIQTFAICARVCTKHAHY